MSSVGHYTDLKKKPRLRDRSKKKDKCKHNWIRLGMDTMLGSLMGTWYWCNLCGATKHFVDCPSYYGYDTAGVYIRHVGRDKEAFLHSGWKGKEMPEEEKTSKKG